MGGTYLLFSVLEGHSWWFTDTDCLEKVSTSVGIVGRFLLIFIIISSPQFVLIHNHSSACHLNPLTRSMNTVLSRNETVLLKNVTCDGQVCLSHVRRVCVWMCLCQCSRGMGGVAGQIYVDDINSLLLLREREGSMTGSGGPFFQYFNAHTPPHTHSASHIPASTWK